MRISECGETDLIRDDKIRWSSRTLMGYHVINSLVTFFSVNKLHEVGNGSDFPTWYVKLWCLLSALLGASFAGSTILDESALIKLHDKTAARLFYGFFNLRWHITYLLCSIYYFVVAHTWIYYGRLTNPIFSHHTILLLYTVGLVVNLIFASEKLCSHDSPGDCQCSKTGARLSMVGNLSLVTRMHNIFLAGSHIYICLLARNYWGVVGSIFMALNMISEVRPEINSCSSRNSSSSNDNNDNDNQKTTELSSIAPSVYIRRQLYLIGSILSSFCITFSFGIMIDQSDVVVKNFSLQAILNGQRQES